MNLIFLFLNYYSQCINTEVGRPYSHISNSSHNILEPVKTKLSIYFSQPLSLSLSFSLCIYTYIHNNKNFRE